MKKIFSICFTLLIVLGTICFATEDFDPRTPKLVIEELKTIPTVNAGGELQLNLKIKNVSKHSASNVRITPSLEKAPLVYERPIIVTLEKGVRTQKETEVSFSFKVSDTAKKGIYTIPFKLQYDNIYDQTFTSEQDIYFKVINENSLALFTISNIETSVETITPNLPFELSFNLNNIGDLEAKNIKVVLSGLNKDEFIAIDSSDMEYIDSIDGKESKTIYFQLKSSKDITTGTHSLKVELSYNNSSDESTSENKTVYITNVNGKEKEEEIPDTEGGTPKVMISSYYSNPSYIKAGNSINFGFTFTNTNSIKKIKNMKVTVSSAEGAFMIAKGSNTFYVESMKPKQSISKSIELNVKQDLTSKSYPVSIAFDYEDLNGNNYTSTEVINLPVTEYSKLVINSVNVGEAYVGGNTTLSFDYINMGKATVSNLTADVEGDYKSIQPINYIGNLNAGTADYYDIEVSPTKDGENFGTLILSFEDSSGKITEVKKAFQGYGIEQYIADYPVEQDINPIDFNNSDEEVFHLSAWAIIGIGVATFAVSFVVTKIIVTKILRKKLEDEI